MNKANQNLSELIGKHLSEVRDLEIGTYYPVIDLEGIVRAFFSAEEGTPVGYRLNEELQAWVKVPSKIQAGISFWVGDRVLKARQEAFISDDGMTYQAACVDAQDRPVTVLWDITNAQADDAAGAADWARPYAI